MKKQEQVLKYRKEGKTIREIMGLMGFKTTSAVSHYLQRERFRRVVLTEDQIILLESILIQIKPTSEFTAEAMYDIQGALRLARGSKE